MLEIINIMNKLLETILNLPKETQTIEFKRLEGKRIVGKIVETISAMANTDGGSIILGIDDPEKTEKKGLDRIYGIEENLENYDEIIKEFKKIIPPITRMSEPQVIKINEINKRVVVLKIEKALHAFHSVNDNVFMRLHKGNKKLSPQEIVELNYAKGFKKADTELVDVDFELLDTEYFRIWRKELNLPNENIDKLFFQKGLAMKNKDGILLPTRAAVLLFAQYPTNLMDTKCTIRVYKYKGVIEQFKNIPNLVGEPKTIDGPIIKLIADAHEYVLGLLESGIEMHSGFTTKYKIPERAVKEAITNAVIHRDYNLKRDIEVRIFEDRIDILSPGLFSGNITVKNIGKIRANEYRNDIIVKNLREFPEAPNLDRNEGVSAMRQQMVENNLYPPIFFTYPNYFDSVMVVLLNEIQSDEWGIVKEYLENNNYINNEKAREITHVEQSHNMSRLFRKWVENGLILKIETKNKKDTKYKLLNKDDL